MKLQIQILILTLLLSITSYGQQKKYFINGTSKILHEVEYRQNLSETLDQIQKVAKSTKVFEELDVIKKSQDSILYSYQWHFTDNPQKTEKEINRKKKIIGKPFPLFNVESIDGKVINLESLKGKPTIINLWFTNCTPCIEEMPILNKIKKQFGDKCNYVAITFDPKDKVQKILSKVNFDFTQIVNSKQLTKKMGFNSYPSNIFLDKNGIVRQIEGGVSYVQNEQGELTIGSGEEFVKIIEKYIREK